MWMIEPPRPDAFIARIAARCAVEHTVEVDLHHLAPGLVGVVTAGQCLTADARVADGDVDVSEDVEDVVHRPVHCPRVAHVERHPVHAVVVVLELLEHRVDGVLVEVPDRDVGTGAGHHLGTGTADARRPAGDDGDLAAESVTVHDGSPFWSPSPTCGGSHDEL
jgi:hypothetical protein